MSESYSQREMINIGIAFLILPIIAVALRIWAKTLGRRGLAWDDNLILIALASYLQQIGELPGSTHWYRF